MASTSKHCLVPSTPQKTKTILNISDDFDDDELLRLAGATELEHVLTPSVNSLALLFHLLFEICTLCSGLFYKPLLISYISYRIENVLAMKVLYQSFRILHDMIRFTSMIHLMVKKLSSMILRTIFLMWT